MSPEINLRTNIDLNTFVNNEESVTTKIASNDTSNSSKKINKFAIPLLHCLSFCSGTALGMLTGLCVTVGLASPIGLIITGSLISVGLIGSFACGGKKGIVDNLAFSISGFSAGFFVGGISGALAVEHGAVYAAQRAGLTGAGLRNSVNAATRSLMWVIPAAFSSIPLAFAAIGCAIYVRDKSPS